MKRVLAPFVLAAFLATPVLAGEIGFTEDFSLARDRAVPLKQLIPGTEDYYYYQAIHNQNEGRLDEVDKLVAAWLRMTGGNRNERIVEIENRQALLRYDRTPRGSLDYLALHLGLLFNHQRQVTAKGQLPTALDAATISRDTLARRALANHSDSVSGFEDAALEWLVASAGEYGLGHTQRQNLLSRLRRPDIKDLPAMVVEELTPPLYYGFGQAAIHSLLTQEQLDECLQLRPALRNEGAFVNAYLAKLRPDDDTDWRFDAKARQGYLDRLWAFVSTLAPAHNSLKAHVLYHRLLHDRALGVYDKDRFLAYIALPRQAVYVNRRYIEPVEMQRHLVDFSADYQAWSMLPPVGNDEPLVRSYLAHFFLTQDELKPFDEFLSNGYLTGCRAETKLLNGLGEPERWTADLGPGTFKALKDRVDIDFAFTNKVFFAPGEKVSLDVHVKNVDKLIVKVFEINAANYYRLTGREVDTAVPLDGLVANVEDPKTYSDPPLRRMARTFAFPALDKPGLYVVEFIGNGKSSRAVVRKGRLHHLVRTSTAGHVFTVLDDARAKVADAAIWMAGREYKADKDGQITIPFTASPVEQTIILTAGPLATLAKFSHQAERYQLSAGFYVDRESLLSRRKATVLVRPALAVNSLPVTLAVLEEVSLTISSTDLDGVATVKEIKPFKLGENAEAIHEFQTPTRLANIAFTLKAKVQNLSLNKKEDLLATQTFSLNQIDASDKVEDLHLAHAGGAYVLDLLGKTGEPRADRPVNFVIKHRFFTDPAHVTLQTDAAGRIALGPLAEIATLTATGPEGTSHTWALLQDRHNYPSNINGKAGRPLTVPIMSKAAKPDRAEVSLLERRGDTFKADRFESLSIKDGLLVIQDLPAGDYDLLLKREGAAIRIRLTDGQAAGDYVLSPNRHLQTVNAAPLQIADVSADKDGLTIRLANAGPFARVHVVATRFMPEYPLYNLMAAVPQAEPWVIRPGKDESQYVAGRDIGDEYRYIIDRKYAAKFPGVMLARPSLLLNPWDIRSTETGVQVAAAGGDFAAHGPMAAPVADLAAAHAALMEYAGNFANLDFLARPSVVLTNLEPDKNGVVTVPRKLLADRQQVQVLAVDPANTAYRETALAEVKSATKDLRLLSALDTAKHYAEQKKVTVVAAKETFRIADILTSQFETYDTLGKVYALYATLSNNATLNEFAFVMDWPRLTEAQRAEKYAKYACHELNFFLYRKDKAYFEKVVLPFLKNKKDKTFMDHYLTGADLKGYLQPWAYARLNVVERILLADRLAAERAAARQAVSDLYDLIPPDVELFNRLFATALRSSGLETGDRYGVEKAKSAAGRGWAGDRRTGRMAVYGGGAGLAGNGGGSADGGALGAAVAEQESMDGDAPAEAAAEARAPSAPAPAKPAMAKRPEGALRRRAAGVARDGKGNAKADGFFADDMEKRGGVRRLYQKMDQTKEWVENNYYRLPIEQQAGGLVTVNAFWRDWADHVASGAGKAFLSGNLAYAGGNFTEMMLALAVLDLPFEPAKNDGGVEEKAFRLTPGASLVVYHKEITETPPAAEKTPVLVSQNYFRRNDRYRYVNNEQADKFVTDEFLAGAVYGCQVVVTNPTSSRQKLDVLLQIPCGSLPVLNGQETRGLHVRLEPFSTAKVEYFFYFPAAGQFAHYPVHVAKEGRLIAFAEPASLKVVTQFSKVDTTSWDWISQNGTGEQVIEHLKTANLGRTALDRIAWRMADREYFVRVIDLLAGRHGYDGTLWSYGIKHDVPGAAREFLKHQDAFLARCGDWIDCTLVTIDPVERRTYQHAEYWPLVNARAHRLGARRQIVNERVFAQYTRLLKILSYRKALDDEDLMAVTYYLLLQDRMEEATGFFDRVKPQALPTKLQYDYFQTYAAFARGDVKTARKAAGAYADYPVERWRKLFAAALAQLDEIDGKGVAKIVDDKDREQAQTALADTEASFDFTVEARKIRLNYQAVKEVRVNYYLMDIELLFSRNPFVQQFSGPFSTIRPNFSETVSLKDGAKKTAIDLPGRFAKANVMVEIVAGAVKKSQAVYANAMAVQVVEPFGQVTVGTADEGKPLAKVYVKVYARMKDGQVAFYKDGYTDLRGKFDYTSLNTNELDNVEKFSLLILSDTDGAVVREANPPKR